MKRIGRARCAPVAIVSVVVIMIMVLAAGIVSGAPEQSSFPDSGLSTLEKRLAALETRVTQLAAENSALQARVGVLEEEVKNERWARGVGDNSVLTQARVYTDDQIRVAVAPDPPSEPTITNVGYNTVALAWRGSNGAAGYKVYRDNSLIATVKESRFVDKGCVQGQRYAYEVSAIDPKGIESLKSNAMSVTLLSDPVAPTTPSNLTAQAVSMSRVRLTWQASRDNISVVGYQVLAYASGFGVLDYGVITGTSFEARGLNHDTSYEFHVMAVDPAGNKSHASVAYTTTDDYTEKHQTFSSSGGYNHSYLSLVGQRVAQTFTYPVTGAIWAAQVNLQVEAPTEFRAQIQTVDINGRPSGHVLAERVLRVEASGLAEFAFGEPARVTRKTNYAFVLSSEAEKFQIRCTTPDSYDEGMSYIGATGQWRPLVHLGQLADLSVVICGASRFD